MQGKTDERLEIVRRDEWPSLPVQPPAGYFRWLATFVIKALFGTAAVYFPGAIIASALHEKPSWIFGVAGLVVLECAGCLVIAVLALRPYRAERKLGYTTWPSLAEIRSAGAASTDAPLPGS